MAILLELDGLLSGDLGPGGGGIGGVSTRESGEYDPLVLKRSKVARELGGVCVSWRLLNDSRLDSGAGERLEVLSLGVIGRLPSGRIKVLEACNRDLESWGLISRLPSDWTDGTGGNWPAKAVTRSCPSVPRVLVESVEGGRVSELSSSFTLRVDPME